MYHVNGSNTNRQVTFRVQATSADANAALFTLGKGEHGAHPHYGELASPMTPAQELGQLRADLICYALSTYNVIVGLRLADDSHGTGGLTANSAPALEITFEADEQGEYFRQEYVADPKSDRHEVSDRADKLGIGTMYMPKSKKGLASLLADLANISYDGGTTGPFGALSGTGVVVLKDGTSVASALPLTGGLEIALVK